MAKKFTTLILFFCTLYLWSIVGCHTCSDDQVYFRVLDVFAKNGMKSSNNRLGFDVLDENSTVSYQDYYLVLTFGVEYFSDASPFHMSNPFLQTAYACNPPDPISSEEILSMNIISNADLQLEGDSIVTAGSSLNDHFGVDLYSGIHSSVREFVKTDESQPTELPIFLFLNTSISVNQNHKFTVYFELDSGKTHTESLPSIIISP